MNVVEYAKGGTILQKGDFVWILALCGFSSLLIIPADASGFRECDPGISVHNGISNSPYWQPWGNCLPSVLFPDSGRRPSG